MCNIELNNLKTIENIIQHLLKYKHLICLFIKNKKIHIPWNLINDNWSLSKCEINGKKYKNVIEKNIQYKKLLTHILCMMKKTKYNRTIKIDSNTKLFNDNGAILPKHIVYKIIKLIDKNIIVFC